MLARWVLPFYWIACFTATHLPPSAIPSVDLFPGFDKCVHFGMYLGLGLLILEAFPRLPRRSLSLLAILICYALIDELSQMLAGRDCEFLDGVADTAGGVVALLLFHFTRRQAVPLGKV